MDEHPVVMHARSEAKTLFKKLDDRFEPRVYFVCFPIDEKSKPGGVGPADTPYHARDFQGVLAKADKYAAEVSENNFHWMPDPNVGWTEAHERLNQSKERGIRGRAIMKAMTEAANRAPGGKGFASYCSMPVDYNGQRNVFILQLQRDIHDSYYQLQRATGRKRGRPREYRIDRSLIDAVAVDYLGETMRELTKENPGAGLENIKDLDHLLLNAAKSLMHTPGLARGNDEGLQGLFDACNSLSTMKYEGKEGVGRLILARPDHPHVKANIALASAVPLRSLGAVRKMLQMAGGELSLLCDSYEVYGLGRVLPSYDPSAEDVFTVRFTKQFVWSLLHHGDTLMHVRYGVPGISLPGFPRERFVHDLPRVFPGIGTEKLDRLTALASCVADQKHGCMLVISGNAAAEAERLNNQGTKVEPFLLSDDVVPLVTTIDGSVLVDTGGICHAIGVILDGMASPKCSPERGSRYNSAVRYVYGRREGGGRLDAVAVVKSEDGMVSVFPELRPQIRRSEFTTRLQALRKAVGTDPVDMTELWEILSWLYAHDFYLSADEGKEIERLHEEAKVKRPPDSAYMDYGKRLLPYPDMDESYFLPE
ncbi:MAG: hypothetical protein JWO38_3006 [Gemmataceae bacterium]|nr:hypothetical protein [Gemmataceae bacterium]